MNLPISEKLPIKKLAACFNSTSATYKFYWLLSILQEIETGKTKIAKKELFGRMISNAWFTVNYFQVSFGKQDLIQDAIIKIKESEEIPIDQNQDSIVEVLIKSKNKQTEKNLLHFDKNVPHWFLSPWFPKCKKNEIYQSSQTFNNSCLYGLFSEYIEINPIWSNYLQSNSRILKDYCYWNLSLFLQTRNPNVPDIPNKLIKPAKRNTLTKQRTKFWDIVLKEVGSLKCIYTDKTLTLGNYAIEHFIPYSFVSHDLIWNLIPADSSFNSSKSNKLPLMDKYFLPYFNLQKLAVDIVKRKEPNNKFLEDYLSLMPDINQSFNLNRFRERIQPLVSIAANNGFEYMT
jgi:5-methylcytosine-specific restriction endonuclease McrA